MSSELETSSADHKRRKHDREGREKKSKKHKKDKKKGKTKDNKDLQTTKKLPSSEPSLEEQQFLLDLKQRNTPKATAARKDLPSHNSSVHDGITSGCGGGSSQSRSFAPMTAEDYRKRQEIVREVFDPDTGRTRLVKGDGEIVEQIVSKERQRELQQTSTSWVATTNYNGKDKWPSQHPWRGYK